MTVEKIDLYEHFKIKRTGKSRGYLTIYRLENCMQDRIRPAILVLGGGGYGHISPREQEPVAMKFLEKGFNAFTLDYSTKDECDVSFPSQLIEGGMAMAYIKKNSKGLGIDEKHVAAIGFSAGGHLCGMLATMFHSPEVVEALGSNAKYVRPDAVVLSYPVITSGEYAHRNSLINLAGKDDRLIERLSLENNVTAESSPAFIWATTEDGLVPVENSMIMATAYKKNNVAFELHLFEKGGHGLSVATQETLYENVAVQQWLPLCMTWLKERGFIIKA